MSEEKKQVRITKATMPAGGWGSVGDVSTILTDQNVVVKDTGLLLKQNKTDGFACVSCAWAKPANPHPFEFCASGAKATAWEITSKSIGADFFQRHTLTELEGWSDHELEDHGRLTTPLRYDAASDKYLPVDVGCGVQRDRRRTARVRSRSRSCSTHRAAHRWKRRICTSCWRACTATTTCRTARICATKARRSACRKPSALASARSSWSDFDDTDCILFFGQNVGVNSPRMLHQLQEARKRDVPIITFNPLRERGLVSFTNPQSPLEMLTRQETAISTQYHQVKPGGDTAVIMGMCKALFALDDAALAAGEQRVHRHRVHPGAHQWLRGLRGGRARLPVGSDRA